MCVCVRVCHEALFQCDFVIDYPSHLIGAHIHQNKVNSDCGVNLLLPSKASKTNDRMNSISEEKKIIHPIAFRSVKSDLWLIHIYILSADSYR